MQSIFKHLKNVQMSELEKEERVYSVNRSLTALYDNQDE